MMTHSNPTIEINRESGKLCSVKLIIPIWSKIDTDNFILVKMPLLGLETYAKDESDIHNAARESITCFCIASDKYGIDIETELELLGWKAQASSSEHSSVFLWNHEEMIDDLLETGDETAMEVKMNDNDLICA